MTESTPTENTDRANPQVVLETGLGRIVIEVYEDRAPKNAAYFLEYVASGAYDGSCFYRAGASVAADAHPSPIIQGGFLFDAATGEFSLERNGSPVKTLPEFDTTDDSGITHGNGTVSLARNILASGDGIPEFFICTGDSQIYSNHLEQVREQLQRQPRPLPRLEILRKPDSIYDYRFEDFELVGYDPHPHIAAPVAV